MESGSKPTVKAKAACKFPAKVLSAIFEFAAKKLDSDHRRLGTREVRIGRDLYWISVDEHFKMLTVKCVPDDTRRVELERKQRHAMEEGGGSRVVIPPSAEADPEVIALAEIEAAEKHEKAQGVFAEVARELATMPQPFEKKIDLDEFCKPMYAVIPLEETWSTNTKTSEEPASNESSPEEPPPSKSTPVAKPITRSSRSRSTSKRATPSTKTAGKKTGTSPAKSSQSPTPTTPEGSPTSS